MCDPRIEFPPELPISDRVDEIAAAVRDHQVVVVAGETGSGKTTQLPKICLKLGRTKIGHTQPRRIAARTVAERIAEELQVELGDLVGYQVRFTRKASKDTRVKVMTDGVLLAEIAHDRQLRRYDTIIIDEAHERSLNIDFLLGYLRTLLPKRPELKVIITSATIDTERFAAHFADEQGNPAPIVEVSGRTYPVEVRYRPLLEDPDVDQSAAVAEAVKELAAEGDGDILIFFSGEREIRDAAETINGLGLRFTEVLPLYARLSAAEQHKVFSSHTGRRIVLATNVAETSLTVPGIRYVIDTGLARISRYSARTKVQRLPIEPISRASADQRAGRCGRVAPGICIRLYEEEDYLGRPEFTEPEILRTNLASVILQLTAADLGEIRSFPFVEAPDAAQITDGIRLLDELGALRGQGKGDRDRPRLTKIGHRLAAVPLDPRMGRMLLAGERYGCLAEMLIIVAGLSIQDPRERPADQADRATALHRRFWAPSGAGDDQEAEPDGSDFIAYLRLWDYLKERQKSLSGNAFRRLCRDEFLHFLRIREWQDLHGQLRQIARDLGLGRNTAPASHASIHTAVLSGLLSHVGLAEPDQKPARGQPDRGSLGRRQRGPREYLGARGTRFAINPGSSVAKTQPPLVMAAEIVETTRLWARTVAPVDAAQIEEVGGHLLKRSYAEPHWSARAGSVVASETVSLYGIPIIAGRPVGYGKINPAEAREIFIRSALVEGDWRTRHRFFAANAETRAEAEELEERTRRRDIVVDDQVIFDFYDARIPAEVVSGAHFDRWWKDAQQETPDLLTLSLSDLVLDDRGADPDQFPDVWSVGSHDYSVSYRFDPGTERDGVSVEVPLALLNQVDPAPFSWQVPGARVELATELIRSLPKAVRRNLVPAREYAERALAWLDAHPDQRSGSLTDGLARAIRGLTGELIEPGDWRTGTVPGHVETTFVITDGDRTVAEGKDLTELRDRLVGQVTKTLRSAAADRLSPPATTWKFGEIATELRLGDGAVGYPALSDAGDAVAVTVLDSPLRQRHSHRLGLRRLVLLNIPDITRWLVGGLSNTDKLALGSSPYPSVPELLVDARLAAVSELIDRAGGADQIRSEAAFRPLADRVRADAAELALELVVLAAESVRLWQQARAGLDRVRRVSPAAADDLTEQLRNLVFAGFLAATPYRHLVQVPRYLRAAVLRAEALPGNVARDDQALATVLDCEDAYAELCAGLPPGPLPDQVAEIGWLIEELRVSLFAQRLGTAAPVSAKRIMRAIEREARG
ncbi:ATP-dependent RNA helicase HrpA [Microlunatus parietis]|uniref:ATP-dependent helicase HrpA n=2 Tax=Microlunatus parietis TaxID=682979 RepID=A0A7Y9IFU9_9ACTN|nr:ATP-dependent RNA helicase HrpA [Microlunatus parietis]NYE75439.1 ATP-dependent helicase HrpA [Microlunatus parietis]